MEEKTEKAQNYGKMEKLHLIIIIMFLLLLSYCIIIYSV